MNSRIIGLEKLSKMQFALGQSNKKYRYNWKWEILCKEGAFWTWNLIKELEMN